MELAKNSGETSGETTTLSEMTCRMYDKIVMAISQYEDSESEKYVIVLFAF